MENTSGITPVEYKVLVLPDQIDKMSKGGIALPGEVIEKEELAQTDGVLVAVTDMSFQGWECDTPKPGDRVKFARYAGLMIDGADGKRYRLIKDTDIAAIIGGAA